MTIDNQSELRTNLQNAKHSLKEAGNNIKKETEDKVEHAIDEIKKRSLEFQEVICDYVKENPGKSLGWGILGGVLVGLLIRR